MVKAQAGMGTWFCRNRQGGRWKVAAMVVEGAGSREGEWAGRREGWQKQ